jgi:hypothetical protein
MRVTLACLPVAFTVLTLACSDTPTAPRVEPALEVAEVGGGCPNRFQATKVTKWSAFYRVVGRDPADDNLDFVICALITKEPEFDEYKELRSLGVVVLLDNNVPADKLGKCPVTFTALAVTPETPEDLNRNGVLCKVTSETEGTVYADDTDS